MKPSPEASGRVRFSNRILDTALTTMMSDSVFELPVSTDGHWCQLMPTVIPYLGCGEGDYSEQTLLFGKK